MTDDFRPAVSWNALKRRAATIRQIRAFFDSRGYIEVQTPSLSKDIVVDAHLDPFTVQSEHGTLFLQTSPEFAMKRLLCDGADAIYQICQAFRQGESGPHHNPEFTMLEWYKVGATYHDQMSFTEDLIGQILSQTRRPFNRITYDEAFHRAIGTKVLRLSAIELREVASKCAVQLPETLDRENRDDLLNVILAECVEPTLGVGAPEFVFDYPASQSALATVRDGDPSVAERFELYYHGIELCNGYQELTDPDELVRRNDIQNQLREQNGRAPLPVESRLIDAMRSGLPDCSGVALGLDRLVALPSLREGRLNNVWAFPIDRA